jgi:aminopeptidase N
MGYAESLPSSTASFTTRGVIQLKNASLCLCRLVPVLILTGLLAACGQDRGRDAPATPQSRGTARPVVDALDKATADARRARVANVAYELAIALDPGAAQFGGEITIRFDLSDPADDLTLDFGGGTVLDARLNGQPFDGGYNGFFLTLPAERLRQGANTATIRYRHPYSEDGTGLHRFTDPADGLTYLYTYLWPYYANRLFPAFDQPNLKAQISLSVRAPQDWIVVSTAPGSAAPAADGSATWNFDTTAKMATYAFSLHAGPYRVWQAEADGIPLRLLARQSLADYVAVEEWFDVSRRGLSYYGAYFDIPYPYHKYDQLIVPDFNIGAMENIAAVTFSEDYVQRQASDRSQRERRASVILHEMAHMWFGNLVTHNWWNGLWLNESFATQMAAMAELQTTDFSDTWHGFFTDHKQRAYSADSRVTTHPIEGPVNSTADFFTVFDAITYQKGSSVLKQLAHYVGEENYRRGVAAYLKAHAYGNTELEDFVASQAQAAGRDLSGWSRDWLYQAGFNTLQAMPLCQDGRLSALSIRQTAPVGHPVLRHHQVDVALYALGADGRLQPAEVIPAAIEGAETPLALPGEQPCPALINPNHQDWTLAQVALDERSLETLATRLGEVPEPLARSMFLAALAQHALEGKTPLAAYLEQLVSLAQREDNIRVQQQISTSMVATVALLQRLRPATDRALAAWLPRLEELSLQQAGRDAGEDLKRAWLATFIGIASSPSGLEAIRQLLDGRRQIPGLPIVGDLRWQLLIDLARSGPPDLDALLQAERAADSSDYALKSSLTADAARPERARKEHWLAELQNPESLSGLARQRAVMAGLFPPGQTALEFDLLPQILQSLPLLSHRVDPYFMSSYVSSLLPPMCRPDSVALLQKALDEHSGQLDSTALKFLREAQQADAECLALRQAQ